MQVCNTSVHVAGSLNHESTSKHSIIVQAIVAAGTGNLLVRTFPIMVNDVNEAPTVRSQSKPHQTLVNFHEIYRC